MLVLALESSSRRGSVALVDGGRLLAEGSHDQLNAHGERLVRLVDDVFRDAGRSRLDVTRIAVGKGPGAFTGLRVGIALASGIASGLDLPIVGIGSLRAMAAGLSATTTGVRWPILDARRGEVFVAGYDEVGNELVSPKPVPLHELIRLLGEHDAAMPSQIQRHWLIGQAVEAITANLAALGDRFAVFRSAETDFPTAAVVGRLGSCANETGAAVPEYLRDADAVLPSLPPSPLSLPREAIAAGATGLET